MQSPREISFETDESADDLRTRLEAAFNSDSPTHITFTDSKGKQYFVQTSAVAYIELGGEQGRKVGFIS